MSAQGGVDVLRIPAQSGLDPITVYIEQAGEGAGRATIVCYNEAWTCYWGAMGCDLLKFVSRCDAGYVAGNMVSGRKIDRAGQLYATRVAQAFIDAALAQAQGTAASGSEG